MIEKITPELLDGALAGGATHVEHYEIATYDGPAQAGRERWARRTSLSLLQENLEQEQETLAKVESGGGEARAACRELGSRV